MNRLCILLSAAFLISFASAVPALKRPGGLANQAVNVPVHDINITVDPRIELIMTAQLISGYPQFAAYLTRYNFTYRRLLIDYFRYHTEHPVVNTLIRMYQNKFVDSTPLEVMLHFSAPPQLKINSPLDRELLRKAGGAKDFKRFHFDIMTFGLDTKFMEFYNFSGEFFQRIINQVFYTLHETDLTEPLDRYMRGTRNSYTFILAPLAIEGAYGIYVGPPDSLDAYCVLGPRDLGDNGEPVFGDLELFRREAWHMFGHSYVNFATSDHRDEINAYRKLFDPIRDSMRREGIGTWEECVNEHIVRAVMSRLYASEVGPERGKKYLEENRAKGFLYLPAVVERLAEYERGENRYKTFDDFYPRLVTLFGELQQSAQPARIKRPPR